MNYIWNKYAQENKYIIAESSEIFSPYLENCHLVNEYPYCLVNSNIRFSKIFSDFIQVAEKTNISIEDRHQIENCLLHYLAQLDRKTGISKDVIEEYIIANDIKNGRYGTEIIEDFQKLPYSYQKNILYFLRKYYKNMGRNSYFDRVLKSIYQDAAVYYHNDDNLFLVYLPQAENKQDSICIKVLEYFFMDVTAQIRVFWQHHFGIIGRNETMKIGNIAIY